MNYVRGECYTVVYMARFILLLRGINVGGNKKVPMEKLKEMLTNIGFTNAKTLLNSGNAAFDSSEERIEILIKKTESAFVQTFGFESKLFLRTAKDIEEIIARDPFKNIPVTKDTRLYVTFLSEKSQSILPLPYESAEKDLVILQKTGREVFWMITLSPKINTTDSMSFIEKEYGKDSTTRNWNTVLKLGNL